MEIPLYLELGFKPENITGVEGGDDQARAEFEQSAQELGINYHTGELLDFVQQQKEPFDVVSLDFLGPVCGHYLTILRNLKLSRRAILLINVMGRREQKSCSVSLKGFQDMVNNNLPINNNRVDMDLSDARDMGYVGLYFGVLGDGDEKKSNNIFVPEIPENMRTKRIKSDSLQNSDKHIQGRTFIRTFAKTILMQFFTLAGYNFRGHIDQIPEKVPSMVMRAIGGFRLLSKCKRYSYKSKTDNAVHTYYSDFYITDSAADLYRSISETANFFTRIMDYYFDLLRPEDRRDEFNNIAMAGLRFLHPKGRMDGTYRSRKDTLVFVNSRQQIIARVPIKRLERDFLKYDIRRETSLLDYQQLKNLCGQREEIEG